ncbi:MAG: glycosyl hydrolase [Acutalibacteraceae bacterium]
MNSFSFQLDYAGETRRVSKHWQFCIGSGHAALAHRTDYMKQLKTVHDELGIERVRFHGIFNDDMNVCQKLSDHLPAVTRNRTKLYSFYQVAKIYDQLLEIGVKPFVEIGFMPSALARGKKTVFHYKGNVTMPKSMSEWQDFIREFAGFLIQRYGAKEVESWYFEVWNEPDLACFFHGSMQDYCRLYGETVKALKSVDPNLKVGGPATTKSSHLTEFLDYCKREKLPVDFVSTHQYPTDALGHSINRQRLKEISKLKTSSPMASMRALLQPVFDNVNDFTPALKGYLTREAKRARGEAGSLPLFYTEWSISSNCVAAIHDTLRTSSFLVKTVLDNQGIVDGSSYWTFSDIFEELFFFPDPFCGGFGLLTVDGIKKPAFWAFKLLSELPDTRYCLPITDEAAELAAFRGENGDVFLMLYAQNFDETANQYPIHIQLKNSPHFLNATAYRINSKHGNPVALWEEMGKPAVLSREELEQIQKSTEMLCEVPELRFDESGCYLDLILEENEVVLIKLQCNDPRKEK